MTKYLSIIDQVENANLETPLGRLRTLQLYGIDVWPLIRVRLRDKSNVSGFTLRGLDLVNLSLLKATGQLVGATFRKMFDRTSKTKGIVFFSHPECLAQLDGRWYDRFCDPISIVANRLGQQTVVFEYSARAQSNQSSVQPRLDLTFLLIFSKLVSLIRTYFSTRQHKVRLVELDALLNNLDCSDVISVSEVDRLAAYISCARVLLVTTMRPWRFQLGFVCTYYSASSMAFVMACRKLGIPVYDIQHGVQGESHRAYRPWFPKYGYLPGVLPDGFWCWDYDAATQLQRWCGLHGKPKVVVGGNVWTEFVFESFTDKTDFNNVFGKDLDKTTRQCTVLVTLQPLYEPLPDILLSAMVSASPDVLWLIRLHPSMKVAFAESLILRLNDSGCRNFQVHSDFDHPLPRELMRTDLHVTLYSSAALEAAALGVFSVFLDPRATEVYSDIVKRGQAKIVRSPEELLTIITSVKQNQRPIIQFEKRIESTLKVILKDIAKLK